MRIAYEKTLPKTQDVVVLCSNQSSRVEIHLRQESNGICTLLAFSGEETGQPTKTTVQGPYEIVAQAIAARNAIVAELVRNGYAVDTDAVSLWSLHAQRQIRDRRKQKEQSGVDCKFDPKDVFLDW